LLERKGEDKCCSTWIYLFIN